MMKTYPESVKVKVELLIDRSMRANTAFTALIQIRKAQVDHNEAINLSTTFFGIATESLITTLYMELSKLFENKHGNESIPVLLDSHQKNIRQLNYGEFSSIHFISMDAKDGKLFKYNSAMDMIIHNKDQIESHAACIERVKGLRDKYFAHYDRAAFRDLGSLFERYKVSFEEMENLLLLSSNICNDYVNMLEDTTVYPFFLQGDGLQNLVHFAEMGLQHQRSRLSEQNLGLT